MLRFLCVLVLATTAAHSHDDVVLPELPIPEIDQLFPVDDMAAAFRWADRPLWTGTIPWCHYGNWDGEIPPSRWHVVALSEGQFRQVDALLAGIQQPQNTYSIRRHDRDICEGLDGRFGVYLQGWSQGENAEHTSYRNASVLWTFGAGPASCGDGLGSRDFSDSDFMVDRPKMTAPTNTAVSRWDYGQPHYLLKNRFSVAGGNWAADTELRDTGFSMRFRFVLIDNAFCAGEHTSLADGSHPHDRQLHFPFWQDGPYTDWIPIADLLDGNISAVRPSSWGQIKAQGE